MTRFTANGGSLRDLLDTEDPVAPDDDDQLDHLLAAATSLFDAAPVNLPEGNQAPDEPPAPATDPPGAPVTDVPQRPEQPERPEQPADHAAADLARARRRAVVRALAEDLGDAGDVTTAATVPADLEGTADLLARADGVIAGVDCLREVFAQVDPRVKVVVLVGDGSRVARDDVVATVSGRLRSLLTGERTALNFLCHLSGVATATRRLVDAVEGTGVQIRDTRKTTPGLRLLEKAAVIAGGGVNHRVGLFDEILVKDNHVLAAGGAGAAAAAAVSGAGGRPVQVEVSRPDEVDEVLAAGVTDILLDNFSPGEVRDVVVQVAWKARLEASGNITPDNIRTYAETGVDRIATGAMTHSAPWLDLALDVRSPEVLDAPDGTVALEGPGPAGEGT